MESLVQQIKVIKPPSDFKVSLVIETLHQIDIGVSEFLRLSYEDPRVLFIFISKHGLVKEDTVMIINFCAMYLISLFIFFFILFNQPVLMYRFFFFFFDWLFLLLIFNFGNLLCLLLFFLVWVVFNDLRRYLLFYVLLNSFGNALIQFFRGLIQFIVISFCR